MRLIDADSIPWDVEGVGEIPVITKDEIDQLPTVNIPTTVGELVGVIRCKDCKHKYMADMVWQCPFGMPGGADFWCGYGAERKEE